MRGAYRCASAMDPARLQALFVEYAKASRVLDKHEAEQCAQLCELAKAYLLERAKSFVSKGQGGALLLSYQSDSTPLLAKATFVARHASGQAVVRKAGRAVELLLERVFLKRLTPTGEAVVETFFRDPLPLDNGKGSWQCFSAACSHFPMLKKLGHQGISVSHYCFDRALFSSLDRLMRQRHVLYHKVAAAGGASTGLDALSDLTDWVVSTGCANHDAQNALKWGLASLDCGEEVTKKLHIVIESLRNGYDLLQKALPGFLTQSLSLVDEASSPGYSEEFWASLCIEPVVLQDLVELGLRWSAGRLQIYESAASGSDFMEKLTACMMSVFRFQRFTDSRWCTIGESCRSLVAGLAIGLEGLVDTVRGDPKASDYYIKGFANMDRGVRLYAVVSSLVANVCDSLLFALLEDDRVCLRLQELEDLVVEEYDWLSHLSGDVWRCLSELVPDSHSQELRSWSLLAASIVQAYIKKKVFRVARSPPWSLILGDVQANVVAVAAREEELESISAKVRALVLAGFPQKRIIAGLQLMAEVHWTSTSVEQGHGSAATLHRVHKQYGVNMLCMRSMVHMFRQLLPDQEKEDPYDAKLAKQEEALESKTPRRASARQVFLSDLLSQLSRASPTGTLTKKERLAAFDKHAFLFSSLTDEARMKYASQAALLQDRKTKEIAHELQGLRQTRSLRESRDVEARSLKTSLLRLSNCRLPPEGLNSMAELWGTEAYTGSALQALRENSMLSPQSPPPSVVSQLQDCDVSIDVAKSEPPRPWVATLCRLRDSFRECGLVLSRAGQADRAYAFLFATQSPMVAELLPLERFSYPPPSAYSGSDFLAAINSFVEHTFTYQPGRSVSAADVEFDAQTQVHVLPYLGFLAGHTMGSHSLPVRMVDFVRHAMAGGARPSAKAQGYKTPRVNTELVEQFPWLATYMPKSGSSRQASGSSSAAGQSEPEVLGLDDEAIDNAFEELQAIRSQWQVDYQDSIQHFKVCLLGGAWTKEHVGVACDAVKAYASGKEALDWCSKFGFPTNTRFGIRKLGQERATVLAGCWCSRLQYFYDIFCRAKRDNYQYTSADINGSPVPKDSLSQTSEGGIFQERLAQILALRPKDASAASSSSSGKR